MVSLKKMKNHNCDVIKDTKRKTYGPGRRIDCRLVDSARIFRIMRGQYKRYNSDSILLQVIYWSRINDGFSLFWSLMKEGFLGHLFLHWNIPCIFFGVRVLKCWNKIFRRHLSRRNQANDLNIVKSFYMKDPINFLK